MAQNKPSKVRNKPTVGDEEFQPKGTMLIVGIFFLLLILLWASVYLILLSRGVTI